MHRYVIVLSLSFSENQKRQKKWKLGSFVGYLFLTCYNVSFTDERVPINEHLWAFKQLQNYDKLWLTDESSTVFYVTC